MGCHGFKTDHCFHVCFVRETSKVCVTHASETAPRKRSVVVYVTLDVVCYCVLWSGGLRFEMVSYCEGDLVRLSGRNDCIRVLELCCVKKKLKQIKIAKKKIQAKLKQQKNTE